MGFGSLDYDGLCERAKALHQAIWNLEANCYDYQQKFERQNYDMMELAERARQMNRGRRKTPTGHTGLGGSVFSWIAERYKDAPPKMSLFSESNSNHLSTFYILGQLVGRSRDSLSDRSRD